MYGKILTAVVVVVVAGVLSSLPKWDLSDLGLISDQNEKMPYIWSGKPPKNMISGLLAHLSRDQW